MPRQEPLPAVLAMVLVDQGLVVVAAPILGVFVDVVDLTERVAQPRPQARRTIEIGALTRLALAVSIRRDPRWRPGIKVQSPCPAPIRGR